MKTLLFTLFFTLLNLGANCQNTYVDSIFVMIDTSINKDLFLFKKRIKYPGASIKILMHARKNEGFQKKTYKKNKNRIVNPRLVFEPYYEFESYKSPRQVENLNGLQIYSIEDVSKGDKQVFNGNQPRNFIFVEKLKNSNYNLWKMHLIMKE
jgi:hypothetical protein